ncbi:MAG: glycerophosphodiester phosphodiesterase [Actinobacteria bacterium]|nr:glycerophosphodiester phosphodiesterase [Actinomycetota bacterium]
MRRILAFATFVMVVASGAPARALLPGDNPWLARRILNMAHQGGEDEAPSDTLFALKSSIRKGADMLELDVHATSDGEIVVLHDDTVDRTTNAAGRVDGLTLADIKELDAAYWFSAGCGTCHDKPAKSYVYRGLANGQRRFPRALARQGYRRNDFTIPSLREVLRAFPRVPINIEIKNTAPFTDPYEETLADLLAEFHRSDDIIVVSFLDYATEAFKVYAPEVPTATGTVETALFKLSSEGSLPGSPNPRYVALQVPMVFNGIEVVTQEFIEDAHTNGLAVHVWTVDDRPTMELLIDWGVDGIMTSRPTLLERLLREHGGHRHS